MPKYTFKTYNRTGRSGITGATVKEMGIDAKSNADAENQILSELGALDWGKQFASLSEDKGPYFHLWQGPDA